MSFNGDFLAVNVFLAELRIILGLSLLMLVYLKCQSNRRNDYSLHEKFNPHRC